MTTLGDFLNTLCKAIGVDANDPALVSFLSKSEIATATLDAGLATKISKGLLTIEAAKQNPELKSHFTAQALNALDSQLKELFDEFGLDDATKAELMAEKSSYKRAANLARKIKELEAKKVDANAGDKSKLAQQIDALNAELSTIKKSHTDELARLVDTHKADRINWELDMLYNSFNFAMPFSKEANVIMAKSLINEALTKAGLKIENVDNTLRLATKEGTDYYENNQKVGIKDFIEKNLTEHKVLVIDKDKDRKPFVPGQPPATPPGYKPSKFEQELNQDFTKVVQGQQN